jgi:hypothetical protein
MITDNKFTAKIMKNTDGFSHEQINVTINEVEIEQIRELTLIRAINRHVVVNFSGVIPGADDRQRETIAGFNATAKIVISVKKIGQISTAMENTTTSAVDNNQPLFYGRVSRIETWCRNNVYTVNVAGVSYTDELDVIVASQSFQDAGLTYHTVVEQTLQPFPKARFLDVSGGATTIGTLIIRYQEKAWPFLVRLASRLNTGLVADAASDQPRFWFGVPRPNEWTVERAYYTVSNHCGAYEAAAQNGLISSCENSPCYYGINGLKQLFQLGDQVNLNGQILYVFQAVSRVIDSELRHDYILTTQAGLRQPFSPNRPIAGLSINGKVIAVANDTLKAHLEIDSQQDADTAWSFPCATIYSSEGHTGWYCMPEIGDTVKVYFPGTTEASGYVTCSVRQTVGASAGDQITDPDLRYLRTPYQRELVFDQEGVAISTEKDAPNSGARLKIRVDQNQGVIVSSDHDLKIDAQADLETQVGQINLSAAQTVEFICKESKIVIGPQMIRIEGTRINRAEGESEAAEAGKEI